MTDIRINAISINRNITERKRNQLLQIVLKICIYFIFPFDSLFVPFNRNPQTLRITNTFCLNKAQERLALIFLQDTFDVFIAPC